MSYHILDFYDLEYKFIVNLWIVTMCLAIWI